MDQFLTIRAFTKVVEAGGFAAAAREMGISRSVVNKYVVTLENELGVQLLRRSSRQVSPTEAGLAFYDRANSILNELQEAIAAVTQLQEQPRGNLRINAPMTFGILHISPLLADFMARYPDVHVELVLNDRLIDPIEEGFDITVRIAELSSSTSLITREIAPVRRVLCASPAYLAVHGKPQEPRELREHRCLHYGYQETVNQWKFAGPDGVQSVHINCVMWSNNGESLKQVALRDQGLTLLPTFIVGDDLHHGRLCTVLNDYRPADLTLCAVYPRHRHLSAKVRLFVEFLIERFGARPDWEPVM
ncbi:MAG: LysR substrate-binding domain-containing protein [Candidatus Competibacteraceae bacterium]